MTRRGAQLPGEIPIGWKCATITDCTCPPRPQSAYALNYHGQSDSAISKTVRSTWKLTRFLFGPDDDNDDKDIMGEGIHRPTSRSPRLLQTLPVEILAQILNEVIGASREGERVLCRCALPGTDVEVLKERYLRWKVVDTRSIRMTCSRWHAWVLEEYFSPRHGGVVVELHDVDGLRRRLEYFEERRRQALRDDDEDHMAMHDEHSFGEVEEVGDRSLQDEEIDEHTSDSEVEENRGEGRLHHKARRKQDEKKPKTITSFLSYYLLPEAIDSNESLVSTRSSPPAPVTDWSIIHRSLLRTFPYLKDGGVTMYLGSPLRITNLTRVLGMLSSTADEWPRILLRNGGGIVFWDVTFAWREDSDMYEKLVQDPVLGRQPLLKYYDNPDREYWDIDEAEWIIDPTRRPDDMANLTPQRSQQKFALSRKAHEFIIEQRLDTMKLDAKLLLDIIVAVKGSSSIQVPVNMMALLPASEWSPVLKSSLQYCHKVDFREFIYCNEKQFTLFVSRLTQSGSPGFEDIVPDIWWTALAVTEQAVNLRVDYLIEQLWKDFHSISFADEQWRFSNNQVKELAIGGRGWQRVHSNNFNGGLQGEGHERRWLNDDFLSRFVFGLNPGGDVPAGMAVRGLEKLTLGYGCWAAEISLGATMTFLQRSFSANTLKSLTYWPTIPQQSMSPLHPSQSHHCPLLAYFPNLTDVTLYSVCCPEIFKSFLPTTPPPPLLNRPSTRPSTPQTNGHLRSSSTPATRSSNSDRYLPRPTYNKSLSRRWRITIPRVLKSIARGCRDINQEESVFWSNGPHAREHEQVKAEWLLKTPAWGLVWSQSALSDLLTNARAAQSVLGTNWFLEITFEGMVAVESNSYATGVSGAAGGIHGGRYTGFEGYQGLFPGIPSGALEYKETVFYPLRRPPAVKIVAKEVFNIEDMEYAEEGEVKRDASDDGIRVTWRREDVFLDLRAQE